MRQEVVHVVNNNAHRWGGLIIERVIRFAEEYDLKVNPAVVFAELSSQMVAPQPHTLVQACVTDAEELVGHAITQVYDLFGHRTAMIYQLEIDDSPRNDVREQMFKDGWNQIQQFAENAGCKAIRAWAMNEKLVEVFARFGLKAKPFKFIEVDL